MSVSRVLPNEVELAFFHHWIGRMSDIDIDLSKDLLFPFVRNCTRRQKRVKCEKCAHQVKANNETTVTQSCSEILQAKVS